ncbi:hypothetical protein Y1Q_0007069 [Alligator mississippiensis]|uniref:Uncharacterized protein n=1 Tax=Alligator mississippiensis TaxID=8496 RepID=A0A151N5F8_ALLMI|nr:hypothetical protein Y1Q_0007069 [Alligator mississippiensis]
MNSSSDCKPSAPVLFPNSLPSPKGKWSATGQLIPTEGAGERQIAQLWSRKSFTFQDYTDHSHHLPWDVKRSAAHDRVPQPKTTKLFQWTPFN